MSYEESKLLSLLKKQDIDSLFLEATNYLCQTKSLFEEKKQLQQENEQLKEELKFTIGIVEHNRIISEKNKEIHQLKDNWNKLKEWIKVRDNVGFEKIYLEDIVYEMQELEQGSDNE